MTKMDTVISLLVLATFPQLVITQVSFEVPLRAEVEIVSGDARIFSGESVRLKCSVPDPRMSIWNYYWFRGSEQLPQFGGHLVLQQAHIRDSGKYSCQGVRETMLKTLRTQQSVAIEIIVDGGWAILHAPPQPGLAGHTLGVSCRVRGTPQLHEVILYKDGVEVMRQMGPNSQFRLTNLTMEHKGMYSCRASWDAQRRTHSVLSAETPVQVFEVLSQPNIEIKDGNFPENMIKLICHHEYNAPAPAPPVHYFFYKDNKQLGPATSENYHLVRSAPGLYRCRAKVPKLDLVKWSEPKSFGQETGAQTMKPPIVKPRVPWTVAPLIPRPDSLSPAVDPTTTSPSIHQSTATYTFIQPARVKTQSSRQNSLQATTSTPPSKVQSLNKTTIPKTVSIFEGSTDMTEGSGNLPEESGDMPEESGDMP